MKKTLTIAAILIAAIGLTLSGCKTKSQENPGKTTITLTYANFPPASTFPCVQMERWVDEVEKRTDGKVKVNTFPGGTLLEAKEIYDGVAAGQADIGCLCMAYQPGRFLVTNALGLPLDIPSGEVGSEVLWELYNKYQPKEFAEVKVLTMFANSPASIMSRTPVRTLEDIKGMPLRASGGAAVILEAWGSNPVGMPMSATPESLQKNVISGLFSSLEVMKDFGFAEQCKFVTMTRTVVYPFAVVMNKDKWNALPDDVKKVLDDLAHEQTVWTGRYVDEHEAEVIEWSKQNHGVEFIELSDADMQVWNAKLDPVTEKWTSTTGIDGAAILNDIQQMITKYSAR